MELNQNLAMNSADITEAVLLCMAAHEPVMLWGDVGIGKSQLALQIAHMTGRVPIDIRAVLYDPVDLRGLPSIKAARTIWNPSGLIPMLGDTGKYFVILEELNRAPQSMQNALLQMVLDRAIGENKLAEDLEIISCCNPRGRGVTEISQALQTRFEHLHMGVDLDSWCKWAVSHDIEPSVIAFNRYKDVLYIPETLACPRQWAKLSNLQKQKPSKRIEAKLYAGAVGEGPAMEYMSFMEMYHKLAGLIDAILLNPDTADVPSISDSSSLFAVSSALARRSTVKNFDRVVRYANRLPIKDFQVYLVKDAVRRDKTLTATPTFNTWAIANSDIAL